MNDDTRKLLKECNAGCKMATNTMDQAIYFAEDAAVLKALNEYKDKHALIGNECHSMLNEAGEDELDPTRPAKRMAWLMTEAKLVKDNSKRSVAEIMIDGCNTGIKSLSKFLNSLEDASDESKNLTKKLIKTEQEFMNSMLAFV